MENCELTNILELTVSNLLENDIDNEYRSSISELSNRYARLKIWKTASKHKKVDSDVLKATEIAIDAAMQADALIKHADFEKDAGFITKIILKTLKIAQKILAGLLFKSPLKVGIAYNAMHNVIKFLEKSMKKKIK